MFFTAALQNSFIMCVCVPIPLYFLYTRACLAKVLFVFFAYLGASSYSVSSELGP